MGTGWLRDRVGVVTGASRGIGLACAQALARAGARTVLAARSENDIAAAANALTSEGCTVKAVATDVADETQVERLFEAADELGPLSVLVCAAGILEKGLIEDTPTDVWQQTLAVNLTGTFLCARRAFRSMRANGGGRIVTLGSLSGVYATEKFPGLGAYNVSKNGIVGLTESLAVEGRDHNIVAVCVSPGAVDTEMLRAAAPHLNPGLIPDDVGRLVIALLDSDLAPMSGANIPLFSNR
jgi:NAD(P)-dependent dehydrogenase (short-subunit alcohol dehydrogenase family)